MRARSVEKGQDVDANAVVAAVKLVSGAQAACRNVAVVLSLGQLNIAFFSTPSQADAPRAPKNALGHCEALRLQSGIH